MNKYLNTCIVCISITLPWLGSDYLADEQETVQTGQRFIGGQKWIHISGLLYLLLFENVTKYYSCHKLYCHTHEITHMQEFPQTIISWLVRKTLKMPRGCDLWTVTVSGYFSLANVTLWFTFYGLTLHLKSYKFQYWYSALQGKKLSWGFWLDGISQICLV